MVYLPIKMRRLDHSSHPQSFLGDDPFARFAGRPVGLGIFGLVREIPFISHRAAHACSAEATRTDTQTVTRGRRHDAKMRQQPTWMQLANQVARSSAVRPRDPLNHKMADIEPEHTPIYPVKKRLSGQYEGLAINTVTSCTVHYAIQQSDRFLANLNATRPALACSTFNQSRCQLYIYVVHWTAVPFDSFIGVSIC